MSTGSSIVKVRLGCKPFRIVRNTVGRQNLTRHGVTLISTKKCGARLASEVPKQTRPVKQEKQV